MSRPLPGKDVPIIETNPQTGQSTSLIAQTWFEWVQSLLRDVITKTTAGVKADQIAATSATLAVTPAIQQFHPSAAKAWVVFTASTGAILASYNVSGVVRNSVGNYTLTFTTPFTTANYTASITSENVGSANGAFGQVTSGGRATSTLTIMTFNLAGANSEATSVMVACFGTQ